MAANPTTDYHPGFSTSGILYNGENGLPRFSDRNRQTTTVQLPVMAPINICSSSHGLIACHDPISNLYYIGNPEVVYSFITLPETPRVHYPQHTHVVLATCLFPPIYHLICAVEDSTPTIYTFDTYSSCRGRWLSYSGIDVRGHIIPNTGVSCGAYSYWLTEAPRSITRFDVNSPSATWQMLLDNVVPSVPETRIQLGRIANELTLLFVSVEGSSYPRVTLCRLQDDPLHLRCSSTYLRIPNASQSIPRPIRFQSYYVEVFFWTNGQLILWKMIPTVDGRTCSTSVQMLNEERVHAADGIAHLTSPLGPADFPATI